LASVAGAHAERVARARDLLGVKGRKEQARFSFEGPTLLGEALVSEIPIDEIFVRADLYETSTTVRQAESAGVPVFLVDERTAAKLSDLETPTGIVAVAPMRLVPLAGVLASQFSLALADLNDPGNAGTLLRSAEAFGAGGVVLGHLGVDPYHPKVVRAAMGSVFRLPMAVASAQEFADATRGLTVIGLSAGGPDISEVRRGPLVLVVGHERRGLGPWRAACTHVAGIPMRGRAESLNAAVAGSVALYALSRACQDSVRGPKSQDFPQ
jgi:RNA methyltransferase, TrmH family